MDKIKKLFFVLKNASKAYKLLMDDKGVSFKFGSNKINDNGNVYYVIEPNFEMSGFFAIFRVVLSALYVSDKLNFIPYINIEKSRYNVPGGYKGKNNMWEYYFENKELKKDANIFYYNDEHSELVYNSFFNKKTKYTNGYVLSEEYLKALGSIIKQYVKFNEETFSYLEESLKRINIDDKTIGVHIRGTDYKLGFSDHPKLVTSNDYFEKIDVLLEDGKYNKIFLATDDLRILSEFEKKYGSKIIKFDDVIRSNENKSVIFNENDRKYNEYYLGLEVIRDMYTLSKCEALIGGLSQVATCARIYKYSYGEKYKDLIILDNGLYNGNKKRDKKLKKYENK